MTRRQRETIVNALQVAILSYVKEAGQYRAEGQGALADTALGLAHDTCEVKFMIENYRE